MQTKNQTIHQLYLAFSRKKNISWKLEILCTKRRKVGFNKFEKNIYNISQIGSFPQGRDAKIILKKIETTNQKTTWHFSIPSNHTKPSISWPKVPIDSLASFVLWGQWKMLCIFPSWGWLLRWTWYVSHSFCWSKKTHANPKQDQLQRLREKNSLCNTDNRKPPNLTLNPRHRNPRKSTWINCMIRPAPRP